MRGDGRLLNVMEEAIRNKEDATRRDMIADEGTIVDTLTHVTPLPICMNLYVVVVLVVVCSWRNVVMVYTLKATMMWQ